MTYDGAGAAPFQNYTQQEFDIISKAYSQLLNQTYMVGASGPIYNMEKVEKEFMKFMGNNLNMPGLKLFKVDENGNTELFLLKGNRRTNPCPN